MQLYKTTIVIWSEYSTKDVELSNLVEEAEQGDAYCSSEKCVLIANPETDPDWDETEFFGTDEE